MRPSLASPQKETFHLSFAEVFMMLKGELYGLAAPPRAPSPAGRSCCPTAPSCLTQPWDRVSPTGGTSAVREVPWDEELIQHPACPARWWSWRVQSLALHCSSLASAPHWTPVPNGTIFTCFGTGQRGMLLGEFWVFSLCKWLAGCDGAEEIALDSEQKETRTFSPLPWEKVIYVNLSTTSTRQ